ncbi:MAG: CHAT domain-containing protein [Gammaproteobacteria bacterium]|nr:CHAT domain-containing protein [Gammaproteobacteria bacterium]
MVKNSLFLIIAFDILISACAEVVLDDTLGNPMALPGPHYLVEAGMGRQAGANLFHSFKSFNIGQNEAATFAGPDAISNVISRVTGGEASHIDGWLRCTIPDADMYFLNPAGVFFKPNARLDVQGSLYISTADYLRLGATGRFDAVHPEQSTLTVAAPGAFGFLDESVAGISKDHAFLAVPDGKTLSFTGGKLLFTDGAAEVRENLVMGSFARSQAGQINLVSVASAGEMPVDANETGSVTRFGTIKVTDSIAGKDNFLLRKFGNLDVSGPGGGRIFIRGGRVELNNAYVFADTLGRENGRGVTIEAADALALSGGSRITAQVTGEEASGNAGRISVEAGRITLEGGSQINGANLPESSGAAGDIDLQARNSITISGQISFEGIPGVWSSGILTGTWNNAPGGEIKISTPALLLRDEGEIRTETAGLGHAGNVSVEADTLRLEDGGQLNLNTGINGTGNQEHGSGQGGDLTVRAGKSLVITGRSRPDRPSALLSNVFTQGTGGRIEVSTPSLEIGDYATIQAGVQSDGEAGRIHLEADKLHVHHQGSITTDSAQGGQAGELFIQARQAVVLEQAPIRGSVSSATFGHGNAGQVRIETPLLTLLHGGQIKSSTAGAGAGGEIAVNAADIRVSDTGSVISSQTTSAGAGGTVRLEADQALRILNGAKITSAGSGTGNAGTIDIDARELLVRNAGISSNAQRAGGDVRMTIKDRVHLSSGKILTDATGDRPEHAGGDIMLADPSFVILQDSQLITKAVAGNGGNIHIRTDQFIGEDNNILDASSQQRIDGEIDINAPDIDLSGSLTVFPEKFLAKTDLSIRSCAAKSPETGSHLFLTGRGGLPLTALDGLLTGLSRDTGPAKSVAAEKTVEKAEAYLRQGYLYKALALLRQAMSGTKKEFLLKNALGVILFYLGQHQAAQRIFLKLLDSADLVKNPSMRAVIGMNLGNLLAARQRFDEARKAFRQSAALAAREKNKGLQAKILINDARTALQWQQSDEGILQTARHLADTLPDTPDKAEIFLKLGQVEFSQKNDMPRAARAFRQARQLAVSLELPDIHSLALGGLVRIAEENGEHERALALNRQAVTVLSAVVMPELLYRRLWQRGRLLQAQGKRDQAINAYKNAIAALHSVRLDLTSAYRALARSSFQEVFEPLFLARVDLLLQRAPAQRKDAEREKDLEAARDTLEQLKAAALRDYFQDPCARESRGAEEKTDPHAAVIYPVLLSDRLELLVYLSDSVQQFRVSATRAAIMADAQALRENLACQQEAPEENKRCIRDQTWLWLESSARLYDRLIRPLENLLAQRGIKTLVLVPDGPLYMIPPAALHDGKRFLAEKYRTAIIPGLRLSEPGRSRPATTRILFGGLSESTHADFHALTYADAMRQFVQERFADVTALSGSHFVENNLREALRNEPYTTLQLYSHARFAERGKDSFIVTYDKRLNMDTLESLIGMRHVRETALELLVLSACETARGNARAALGLSGAAFKAGARSALATLWPVREDAMFYLSREFYRQLEQGRTKAAALRRAQLALMRNGFQHPHYWAGFLLIGDWGR